MTQNNENNNNYKYSMVVFDCSGVQIILNNVLADVSKVREIDTLFVRCEFSAHNVAELLKVGMSFNVYDNKCTTSFLLTSVRAMQR